MKQILVYADSLTWGIIPSTRRRLEFHERWPGVMESALNADGGEYRVIENCLNGRRTAWEDPYKPGRNALGDIAQAMEMNSPLALLILMLGTNDFQSMHPHNAWHSAQGTRALVEAARNAPVEPGMNVPPILIVAPPVIIEPRGSIAPKFQGAEKKCVGLAGELEVVAGETDAHFFDSEEVISASKVDGIHLDKEEHRILGEALAPLARELAD